MLGLGSIGDIKRVMLARLAAPGLLGLVMSTAFPITLQAGGGQLAVAYDVGAVISLMRRVYLSELYGTPTDIPNFPRPPGVKPDAPNSDYNCYRTESWRQKISAEVAASNAEQPVAQAKGKSGKPLWPYHCDPIALASDLKELNDQKITFAIPAFMLVERFLDRMRAFQKDPESISTLAMDVERQIEIYAYWVNRPDESFNYERSAHRERGHEALSGDSYQIDHRVRLGQPHGYAAILPLTFADWNGPVTVRRDGAFHIIELQSKKLKTRF